MQWLKDELDRTVTNLSDFTEDDLRSLRSRLRLTLACLNDFISTLEEKNLEELGKKTADSRDATSRKKEGSKA